MGGGAMRRQNAKAEEDRNHATPGRHPCSAFAPGMHAVSNSQIMKVRVKPGFLSDSRVVFP